MSEFIAFQEAGIHRELDKGERELATLAVKLFNLSYSAGLQGGQSAGATVDECVAKGAFSPPVSSECRRSMEAVVYWCNLAYHQGREAAERGGHDGDERHALPSPTPWSGGAGDDETLSNEIFIGGEPFMDTYQIAGREATVLGQLEVGGLMIPILGVKELQDRVVTEEDLRFCTVGFKGALHDVHTGKREVAECPD